MAAAVTPLLRLATVADVDAIYHVGHKLGGEGITNLHVSTDELRQRVSGKVYTFFVLDIPDIGVVGAAAVKKNTKPRQAFSANKEQQKLEQVELPAGSTELCALRLLPEYRHQHLGRLLAWGRYLYLYLHQTDYSAELIAEMRGVLEPGWEARDKNWEVIGTVHSATVPAYYMLKKIGFEENNFVSVIDSGPYLHSQLGQISLLKNKKSLTVRIDEPGMRALTILVANQKHNFIACEAVGEIKQDKLIVDADTARSLDVSEEDAVLVVPL